MCLKCKNAYFRRYFNAFKPLLGRKYAYSVRRPIRSFAQGTERMTTFFVHVDKLFDEVTCFDRKRCDELWELTTKYHECIKRKKVRETKAFDILDEIDELIDWMLNNPIH